MADADMPDAAKAELESQQTVHGTTASPPTEPTTPTRTEKIQVYSSEHDCNMDTAPSTPSSVSSYLSAEAEPFTPQKVSAAAKGGDEQQQQHEVRKEEEMVEAPAYNVATGTRNISGGSHSVLQVSDLHWFTSDADLIEAAALAKVYLTFKDITFLEHKCNGKSKGIAFMNCHNVDNSIRVMRWFENHEFQGKKITTSLSAHTNGKPPVPPPTHDKDNGGTTYRRSGNDIQQRAPLPFLPTNSHGGVNFNRVPLHHRQQMQQMQQAGFLNPANGGAPYKNKVVQQQVQQPNYQNHAEMVHKNVMVAHQTPYLGPQQPGVWNQVVDYDSRGATRPMRI